jgi:Predicted integral membrane protein
MEGQEISKPAAPMPAVAAIGFADLRAALAAGASDFLRAPIMGLFFGAVFAAGGLAIVFSLLVWHVPWMIYPVAAGFPLIGPFVAVGLYEISRRLEAGRAFTWGDILGVIWRQRQRELAWMAFVMLFVFWIWMYQVRLLLAVILSASSFSTFDRFLEIVFTTPAGWTFLAVGHLVGAVLALVLFSLTVVSIPLLLDRERDVVTAMITSVRVVLASPGPMIAWGLFVTAAVIAACLPMFVGLPVVLPILGHATWHLYRRAVQPE